MTSEDLSSRPLVASNEDIVRYFSGTKIDQDVLLVGALICLPSHNSELSVDRLFYDVAALSAALNIVRNRSTIQIRKSGRYVRWNVGSIVSVSLDVMGAPPIRIEQDPIPETQNDPGNPAHAVMLPMPDDPLEADFLLDLLRPLVSAVYPAVPS